MQVVWVYTAIKAITSFPVQELGAREWTLQVFGFRFFFYSCQTLFTKAFVSSVGGLQKHNPALPSHTSVVPCSFTNPELSFGMKIPFKDSVISTLTGLLMWKFFLSLHHSASVKKEQDFIKRFLLASTFDNTERCLKSRSENPGMMVSLKTRSFQRH